MHSHVLFATYLRSSLSRLAPNICATGIAKKPLQTPVQNPMTIKFRELVAPHRQAALLPKFPDHYRIHHTVKLLKQHSEKSGIAKPMMSLSGLPLVMSFVMGTPFIFSGRSEHRPQTRSSIYPMPAASSVFG